MELMRGGRAAEEPSEKEVDEVMALMNEILKLAYSQKYKTPVARVRAMAMAFGRIMGATANNRAALAREINTFLELAREGAFVYMGYREDGKCGPPPARP